MMNMLGCSITDKAPSNQKSINSFLKDTDRGIIKPGERYVCAGFEKKRGSFKRKFTSILIRGSGESSEDYSQIQIGKKNKVFIRYFGISPSGDQVWGELKNRDEAIRISLRETKNGVSGSLIFFDSKGGKKIEVKNMMCKQGNEDY